MPPYPSDFDSLVHSPKRLVILATLEASKEVEFSYLVKRLDITASDLSKQMAALCSGGLTVARKTGAGRASKTWYSMTPPGRYSFGQYKKMLRELIDET